MRKLKKIAAVLLSLSVMTAMVPGGAVEVSTVYNKTYVESFDEAEKVFGENALVEYAQNATESNVYIEEDTAQGGGYLKVVSGGSDVQVKTKKGILKHDVSVIDMYVRATSVSPFPSIRLLCDGVKMGTNQANGLITYTGGLQWRAYNLNNAAEYITYNAGNAWIPVRIILDSVNKTVITNIYGTQMSKVSTLADSWDNESVQLMFQAAAGSEIMIDDLVISDGTYMNDVFMDYSFEHSSIVNTVGTIGSNFFYGINKVQNLSVIYDSESDNSYLDIANAAGNTVYTNPFAITAGRPVVMEFRLKTDATSNGKVFLRQSSAVVPGVFTIENGCVTNGNKVVDVSDGKFHKYRAVFTTQGDGFSMSLLVDNNWIGTDVRTSNTYAGKNLDLRFNPAANATMAIDDLTIYYPKQPKIICDLDGKTDVALDTVVELVSNTQINASTASKVSITANGETVGYTPSSNGAKNSYIFDIEGGLQPETTYVISTGASGLRDMFDQFYNTEITFTTEEAVATPEPTATPTVAPTATPEPTATPTVAPTEEPKDPAEATVICKINGEEVTDNKLTSGTMDVTFNVTSNVAEGVKSNGYVAQFDELGNLISVLVVDTDVTGVGSVSKSGVTVISNTAKTVKILVWDTDLVPITKSIDLVR